MEEKMQEVKELLLQRIEESLKKVEEMGKINEKTPLKELMELREQFIDEVARCCGFRYLYHFLKYPEADPLGLAEDILKSFKVVISLENKTKEVSYAVRSGI